MEDWMRLPVSQLKRLVKGRAGRVAELQMEIKILEGIMERKVREGDLGESAPKQAVKKSENKDADKETPGEAEPEGAKPPEENKPIQSKITTQSSDHSFKEID